MSAPQNGRLAGKTALITAAARGIGRASVERFVAEGARVFATDRDLDALDGLEGCERLALDVTDGAATPSHASTSTQHHALAHQSTTTLSAPHHCGPQYGGNDESCAPQSTPYVVG